MKKSHKEKRFFFIRRDGCIIQLQSHRLLFADRIAFCNLIHKNSSETVNKKNNKVYATLSFTMYMYHMRNIARQVEQTVEIVFNLYFSI